jgi:hypothetical protein
VVSESQVPVEEVRKRRNQKFGTIQDVSELQNSGSINSSGGPVFLGNQNAGRDVNINTILR